MIEDDNSHDSTCTMPMACKMAAHAPMDCLSQTLTVLVLKTNAQTMRLLLEEDGYCNPLQRLHRLDENIIAVPVKHTIVSAFQKGEITNELPDLAYSGSVLASCYYRGIPCKLASVSLPLSKKQLTLSPYQRLINALKESLEKVAVPFPTWVLKEIPNTWEKHGDLILLPEMSFHSNIWSHCPNLWDTVAKILGGQRVARKGHVLSDEFRSPQVELLLGNDGWVEHRDNGIRYTYDVRHCMFSAGNITEKLRVASFPCNKETVVDLYAGIGYFTLPYLVHAKASLVHACEWNPDAIKALRRNLELNKVENRCIIHHGDNKRVCPKGVADRVNLGLIPSSEEGWPVACAALKPQHGGILHIHGNVTSKKHKREGMSMGNNVALGVTKRVTTQELSNISGTVCDAGSEIMTGPGPAQVALSPSQQSGICKVTKDDKHFQKTSSKAGDIKDPPDMSGDCDAWKHTANECWDWWADDTAHRIKELLINIHGGCWVVNITHVQHVKSYAPHVDHIVADIRCLPKSTPT